MYAQFFGVRRKSQKRSHVRHLKATTGLSSSVPCCVFRFDKNEPEQHRVCGVIYQRLKSFEVKHACKALPSMAHAVASWWITMAPPLWSPKPDPRKTRIYLDRFAAITCATDLFLRTSPTLGLTKSFDGFILRSTGSSELSR